MIHYAINHYVTTSGDDTMDSTVHGDNALCVWDESDPTADAPDHRHDQPDDGWNWQTDMDGWKQHPDPLSQYADDTSEIERLPPWDTTLTEGVQSSLF